MKVPISPDIKLDIMRLVESRLLVQASSGGGGFLNSIGKLCTLGLAVRENGGIKLNPEIQNL
jgi:hypothetical protein